MAKYPANMKDQSFSGSVKPIYWISGQQLAMKTELLCAFKAFVKGHNIALFQTITTQQNQDIVHLKQCLLHEDLWSEPMAVIVYLSAKTSLDIVSLLESYVQQKRKDRVVLLLSDGLKDKCSKKIWLALKSQVVHFASDVPPYGVKEWLRKTFKLRGYDLDSDALASIEAASEGNRTLCNHLITQVALLFPPGRLSRSDVMPLLTDQAQFSGYQVVDAALMGQKDLLIRRLKRYPKDASSQYALWVALRHNLRQFHAFHHQAVLQNGSVIYTIQQNKTLWDAQKKRFIEAANRHNLASCSTLLFNTVGIDFTLKGVVPGVCDQMLHQVLFQIAGVLPVKPIDLALSSVLE